MKSFIYKYILYCEHSVKQCIWKTSYNNAGGLKFIAFSLDTSKTFMYVLMYNIVILSKNI